MDCAAQKGTRIRIYIRGLSEQPPRDERCKADNARRRHLKLAVYVAYNQTPKTFVTQSSDVPGVAAAAPSSEEKTAMDAAEYLRILKKIDKEVRAESRTRRGTLNLVHDRASIHTSHVFKDGAEELNWKPILLPTKGCDISPLDTSFFGVAKRKWQREYKFNTAGSRRTRWEALCTAFIQCLEDTCPDEHITSIPGRIAKCIACKGGHIQKK